MQKKIQFAFIFLPILGLFFKSSFPHIYSFPQINKVRSSLVKKFKKILNAYI